MSPPPVRAIIPVICEQSSWNSTHIGIIPIVFALSEKKRAWRISCKASFWWVPKEKWKGMSMNFISNFFNNNWPTFILNTSNNCRPLKNHLFVALTHVHRILFLWKWMFLPGTDVQNIALIKHLWVSQWVLTVSWIDKTFMCTHTFWEISTFCYIWVSGLRVACLLIWSLLHIYKKCILLSFWVSKIRALLNYYRLQSRAIMNLVPYVHSSVRLFACSLLNLWFVGIGLYVCSQGALQLEESFRV